MDKIPKIPSLIAFNKSMHDLTSIPALPHVDSIPFFDVPINFNAIEEENVFYYKTIGK